MSWAKHCCLLKIEGSYQLVAEDTPLCAPWSDNSPLCSAIGFPHLPDLSAPTRTVLHSLAWHRTAVSLPKLSLWHKRGASDAHLDKTARYPDMKSSVEKHFIDPIFETSLEHEVGLSRQFFIFISFQLFSIDKKKKCTHVSSDMAATWRESFRHTNEIVRSEYFTTYQGWFPFC